MMFYFKHMIHIVGPIKQRVSTKNGYS